MGAFGHTAASPPPANSMPPNRPKVVKKTAGGGHHSAEPGGGGGGGPGARALAKKTNSTDNLIEYSAPKSTDTLVKEVQFTLRYFEVRINYLDLFHGQIRIAFKLFKLLLLKTRFLLQQFKKSWFKIF